LPVIDLLVSAAIAKSKGDARRGVQGGGIYLNNRRVSDVEKFITMADSILGKFLVLRKGAKNYSLIKLV
jgi:tyrosyl-tRNA synthetase